MPTPRTNRRDNSRISAEFSIPTDLLLHNELEQKIQQAVAELPEQPRTADIAMSRRRNELREEIAEVIKISCLSATKSLIHRGRETLKQKLKPYLRTGEWRKAAK